jgi:hypothetical protein
MIGTLADFRAYHDDRGNSGPTDATDAVATAALVRGSDYVRRAFTLTVEETDSRVIEAAYVASGFELSEFGFFSKAGADKILTKVQGIEWTVNTGGATNRDSLTPRDMIAAILRGAVAGSQGLLRA